VKVSLLAAVVLLSTGGFMSAQTMEFTHNGQVRKAELLRNGIKDCKKMELKDNIWSLTGKCQITFYNINNKKKPSF
jgi:hypothetical protein